MKPQFITLFIEAALIGITTYFIGVLILSQTRKPFIVLFVTGFLVHLICEMTGVYKWITRRIEGTIWFKRKAGLLG